MNKREIIAATITFLIFEAYVWGVSFLALPGYEVMGGITIHALVLALIIVAWLMMRLWDWVDN